MKAIQQYIHVVLFIMLYKVVLTFKFVDKTLCVSIHMKTIEQYFHVILFIMLYKVVLTFKFVDKTLCVSIHMKAFQQYFHALLFIMLYKAILTLKSVDETLAWDHSKFFESYSAVLSCGTVYYVLQGISSFSVCG